ncbi:hypothetical protein [Nocardia amamiensis]|uniref:hypothetical protein n=1 Tax=Nocardia amamiensis TaxID=404578 RepID=UPI000830F642|nr:hypothetical protein [Nocardia amamiensis]
MPESRWTARVQMNRRRVLGGAAAGTLGVAAAVRTMPIAQAAPARTQQPAPSGTYRIDVHAHFLPPDYRAALLDHGHVTVGGYPTPDWSPEQALAFMDYYGIQAQALSVSDPGVSFLHPSRQPHRRNSESTSGRRPHHWVKIALRSPNRPHANKHADPDNRTRHR